MGLISYLKERYYDYKFKKADQLMSENRTSEAENIYIKLLDKHSFAATRLADYYFSLVKRADTNGTVSLFKKIANLEKKAKDVIDISSYNICLQKISKHIIQRAETLFSSGSYNDCCTILKVLNDTRHKTDVSLDLYCESKINQLLKDICKTKITDSVFSKLTVDLQEQWNRGKNNKRVIDITRKSIDELITSNRFYAANELLRITGDKQSEPSLLNNATQIVNSKDTEASSIELQKTVTAYGKSIILRKGISSEESASIFENCWKVSQNVLIIMEVLENTKPGDTRETLVKRVFNNHIEFLSDKKLLNAFALWLSKDIDTVTSLNNLEKLHTLGYDVEKLYVERLHEWIKTLAIDEKVEQLNHAQTLFPISKIVVDDKLECAQQYEHKKENDKAIAVADSISKKCSAAYIVKAKALYNKAVLEKINERKELLLNNALASIKHATDKNALEIKSIIKDSLIDVANNYYIEQQQERAYSILQNLGKEGISKAVLSIAKHRLDEVQTITITSDKLKASTQAINEINKFQLQIVKQNSDYLKLWDIKLVNSIEFFKALDNSDAITKLKCLVKEINAIKFEENIYKSKLKSVIVEIIRRKYLIARDFELNNKFYEASELYKDINNLEAKSNPTMSALRFIICKLKMQNNSDILEHKNMIYNLLRKTAKAFIAEKEDIAYRFSLILLKSGEDKEALAVLKEFLPSEEHLKKACEQGDMIKAQAKLEEFNSKLEAVKNKSLSSDDAIFFINHILEYAEVVKPILVIPRNTLVSYRNKIKNYAIYKLFDEEKYNIAFEKMLKEHANYLDDLSALRNIALICLNMAEAKQIISKNYKEVIAVWLTAIYQERLFIKSLDYTSWDDKFTFSLNDAYGHFDEYEVNDLPDNVNFDNSDDSSVVYIKEVQRSLLDRFEAAISENQVYHSFYTYQKDAMDALIALNLDEKCRLVAPYLATRDENVFKGISSALERDRENEYDNWENVLSVGAIYQMSGSIYTDYSNAKLYYDNCVVALSSFDSTQFSRTKVSLIKKFNKLYSALVSNANSIISSLVAQDKAEFKKNFKFFYSVCENINDKTLSFAFSKYIMSYVVNQVNDKKMKMSEASDFILSIYILDTSNAKVEENLKTLFEMQCREDNSESNLAVKNILSKVQAHNTTFYRTLNEEYQDSVIIKDLNSIVGMVNNHSLSEKDALEKIYSMYAANPNHKGICNNLSQLAEICIMKYIISNDYNSYSVKNTLNKIIKNKSSEFQNQSSIFRKAYNDIWSQLPNDTKLLLSDNSSFLILGQTLNEKGQALKEGLDLMKQLGGFTNRNSNRFGSINSLLSGDNDLPF